MKYSLTAQPFDRWCWISACDVYCDIAMCLRKMSKIHLAVPEIAHSNLLDNNSLAELRWCRLTWRHAVTIVWRHAIVTAWRHAIVTAWRHQGMVGALEILLKFEKCLCVCLFAKGAIIFYWEGCVCLWPMSDTGVMETFYHTIIYQQFVRVRVREEPHWQGASNFNPSCANIYICMKKNYKLIKNTLYFSLLPQHDISYHY